MHCREIASDPRTLARVGATASSTPPRPATRRHDRLRLPHAAEDGLGGGQGSGRQGGRPGVARARQAPAGEPGCVGGCSAASSATRRAVVAQGSRFDASRGSFGVTPLLPRSARCVDGHDGQRHADGRRAGLQRHPRQPSARRCVLARVRRRGAGSAAKSWLLHPHLFDSSSSYLPTQPRPVVPPAALRLCLPPMACAT